MLVFFKFHSRLGLDESPPYQPIYTAMCERYGEEPAWNQSRLFFGLLVKDVMIQRPEHWLCYKVPEQEEVEEGHQLFSRVFLAGCSRLTARSLLHLGHGDRHNTCAREPAWYTELLVQSTRVNTVPSSTSLGNDPPS